MAEFEVGTVIGGVRVDGVAGRGGMGVVYRATQLALNRTVALKPITPALATIRSSTRASSASPRWPL